MLVSDIVDNMILGTDMMNVYGFVVDLRENVLRVGEEKIKLCMAQMIWSANQQVTVAEEEVNRCEEYVHLMLHAKTKEELVDERPTGDWKTCVATEEVVAVLSSSYCGRPGKVLAVSRFKGNAGGQVTDDARQEVGDKNQTDREGPYAEQKWKDIVLISAVLY